LNINISIPVNTTSYGLASIQILQNLTSPSLFPIGGRLDAEEEYIPKIRESLKRAELYDPNAPSLRIFHEFKLDEFVGRGPKIGYSFFEVNKFGPVIKHQMNNVDRMFVNSEWGKQIIIEETKHTEDTVNVVPLGVDNDMFLSTNKPHGEKTIFLNIGKWEIRKFHDRMAEVFKTAFPHNEAELWMCPLSPFYTKEELLEWDRYYKSILGDQVKFFGKMPVTDLVKLINQSDIGLFPYRSESWCLPLIEMMSCKKKVIATNYSGPTTFLYASNSYLIDVKEMTEMVDYRWFHPPTESTWAVPDEDHLIELMRQAHNNKQENYEGRVTANKFTWKNTAETIERILGSL